MKNSNFINESVFNVNLNYVRLQNQTKELFFKCLEENRDVEYFKVKIREIWGKVDYSYQEEQINEYEALIHNQNVEVIKEEEPKEKEIFLPLVPISAVFKIDKKFVETKVREYNTSYNSYAYHNDKQEYLKLKVKKYNNQIVPYYSKETGKIIRYVQPSTYNSMIHNTNLTRSGWNTTLNDADSVDMKYFWIPYHSFSCPHCMEYQNKLLSKDDVLDIIGNIDSQDGEILHPNCKCSLNIYTEYSKFNKPKYSNEELEEQYQIRQKTNTLTLRKEEVITDMKIQKMLGNQDEVDKLNQQRNKINKEIRELKEALPTKELQIQVVAINR